MLIVAKWCKCKLSTWQEYILPGLVRPQVLPVNEAILWGIVGNYLKGVVSILVQMWVTIWKKVEKCEFMSEIRYIATFHSSTKAKI